MVNSGPGKSKNGWPMKPGNPAICARNQGEGFSRVKYLNYLLCARH